MKLWAGRGENELLASSSPCRPRDHLDGEAGRRLEFSSHFGTVAVYPEFASLCHLNDCFTYTGFHILTGGALTTLSGVLPF
jgi:hypothetical protein